MMDDPRDIRSASTEPQRRPKLPPRWFVRSFWAMHRAFLRLTGRGLWEPKPDAWGTLLLKTTGRRSGEERAAIVAYFMDGPNPITLAMNGWAAAEPAWWLNLQANPDANVQSKGEQYAVRGRAAEGDERTRLWTRWQQVSKDVDGLAARRPTETAVVVLERRSDSAT